MIETKPDGIRALIVDDEAPARQRISDLLNQDPEVVSLQEAGDGDGSAYDPQRTAEPGTSGCADA